MKVEREQLPEPLRVARVMSEWARRWDELFPRCTCDGDLTKPVAALCGFCLLWAYHDERR